MPADLSYTDKGISTTPELEQWAEALAALHCYGERAVAMADDRIAELVGDDAGRARWQLIRQRIIQRLNILDKNDHYIEVSKATP